MSNYDLEEDLLLKYQICLSIVFILTFIISITLSYNSLMECEGKNRIYDDEEALFVLRINRIISFLVAIGFLYINFCDKNLKNKYNYSAKNSNLQILASIITMMASLIALYVAFSNNNNITSTENPEI